jgi:hypothetical protein
VPFPAWIVGIVARLWRRRNDVSNVIGQAQELAEDVEGLIYDDPPPQPLTHKDVEHIRSQVASATSHKVPANHAERLVYTQTGPEPGRESCNRPPPGWWCSREPFHEGACAAYPLGEGPIARVIERNPGPVKAVPRVDREAVTPPQGKHKGPPRPPPPMKGKKTT